MAFHVSTKMFAVVDRKMRQKKLIVYNILCLFVTVCIVITYVKVTCIRMLE